MQEHIFRRLGFGASAADLAYYGDLSPFALVQTLLNFERVDDEVDGVRARVPELMSTVAELKVPLLAEVGVGANWDEAH